MGSEGYQGMVWWFIGLLRIRGREGGEARLVGEERGLSFIGERRKVNVNVHRPAVRLVLFSALDMIIACLATGRDKHTTSVSSLSLVLLYLWLER